MAKLHQYPVTVQWQGGRSGQGTIASDRTSLSADLAVPPEFGGEGGPGTNPEELLTSAIAACYSVTFGIVAANRKLPLVSLTASAIGEVEEQGPSFTFKRVILKPRIVLSPDADDAAVAAAQDYAHKADHYCIITNAVRGKVEIVLEPVIVRGE